MNLDWMDKALCRDEDPELFFPSSVGVAGQRQVERAAQICNGCPVQRQCGEQRKHSGASTGVWGGMYRNIKDAATTRTLGPINHGTDVGYHAHLDRLSAPCHSCRVAHAYANRKWARR